MITPSESEGRSGSGEGIAGLLHPFASPPPPLTSFLRSFAIHFPALKDGVAQRARTAAGDGVQAERRRAERLDKIRIRAGAASQDESSGREVIIVAPESSDEDRLPPVAVGGRK